MSKKYLWLCGAALIWGSQFMLNRFALQAMSPVLIVLCRTLIGTLTLSIVLCFFRETDPHRAPQVSWLRHYGYYFIIGIFEVTLPLLLIVFGQQKVSSSVASILVSTVPIFAVLLVFFFIKEELVSWLKLVAVLLGFIGIIVLVVPGMNFADFRGDALHQVAILLGAVSFAISMVLLRRITHLPPIRTARNVLFCSTLQLALLAALQPSNWHMQVVPSAFIAILLLGVFSAGLVYVMFVQLIRLAGATFASFCNYLIPIVGLAWGIGLWHEPLQWHDFVALFILFMAMTLNELPLFLKKR